MQIYLFERKNEEKNTKIYKLWNHEYHMHNLGDQMTHNPKAHTKHNALHGGRIVWEGMDESVNFRCGQQVIW